MGFIPKGAEWYLADLVVRITVAGDSRTVVHINTHLVRARSPEEAYSKALALGGTQSGSYPNSSDQEVFTEFLGLRDLNVIHDELEDGAELTYSERVGLSATEQAGLVTPKEKLGVFASISLSEGPDYASGEIMKDALRLVLESEEPE